MALLLGLDLHSCGGAAFVDTAKGSGVHVQASRVPAAILSLPRYL